MEAAVEDHQRVGGRWGKLTPREVFLHDLALALGMTVRELSLRMSARELASWRRYVKQRQFPHERLQMQVALLAFMNRSDESMGLLDFVIGHAAPTSAPVEVDDGKGAATIGALAGARVRVLGQKRNQPFRKKE